MGVVGARIGWDGAVEEGQGLLLRSAGWADIQGICCSWQATHDLLTGATQCRGYCLISYEKIEVILEEIDVCVWSCGVHKLSFYL